MPDHPTATPREPTMAESKLDFTMHTAFCPFRKDGTPVVGTMGSTARHVVLMESDDFKRLLKLIPADVLAKQTFGHYSQEG